MAKEFQAMVVPHGVPKEFVGALHTLVGALCMEYSEQNQDMADEYHEIAMEQWNKLVQMHYRALYPNSPQ
jgi:hypothetical protein